MRAAAAELAPFDEREELGEERGIGRRADLGAPDLELAQDLVAHPVADGARRGDLGGDRHHPLEVVRELARRGEVGGILGGEPEGRDEAAPALPGELGEIAPQAGDPLGGERQRPQVGLREIAVVVGFLLAAQRPGRAAIRVEAAGLLDHRLAGVEPLRLTLDLRLERPRDVTE